MRPHTDDPIEPQWVEDIGFDRFCAAVWYVTAAVCAVVFCYVFFWPTQ
jgi:hypothetical protein